MVVTSAASLLLTICIAVSLVLGTSGTEDNVARLKELEESSEEGIIKFSNELFEQFGLAPKRQYTLVGYMYARNLLSNAQLQLPKVFAEFVLAAKAYKRGQDADNVFFFSVEFEDHQNFFQRMGVNQAPFIFTWQPKMVPKASGMIDLANDNQMTPAKTGGYPWKAEDFISFISGRAGLKAGEVVRPTLLNDPYFPFYALGFLSVLLFTAYRAFHSPVVRDPRFWLIGSLVVYWFATSGGLFNIIRGMPMYFINKDRKLQFFLAGRQGQLGVEGFLMGGSYMLFSLLLAGLTYGAPRLKDQSVRAGVSLAFVISAVYLFWKIFDTFSFKNGGYWIRQFFF